MDFFNEAMIMMVMYHLINFSNFVPMAENKDFRDKIGISCFVAVVFSITVSIIQIVTITAVTCRRRIKIYHAKRKHFRNLEKFKDSEIRKAYKASAKGFKSRRG